MMCAHTDHPYAPCKPDLYFSTNAHYDPAVSCICWKLGKYSTKTIKFSLCLESEKIKQLELHIFIVLPIKIVCPVAL